MISMSKRKIGILTWHYYSNVGSNLQTIAMQKIFSTDETETEIINFRPKYREHWYRNLIRSACAAITDCFPRFLPEMLRFRSFSFQKHWLKQSDLLLTTEELTDSARKYDAVICGSDQIWAPNVFRKEYLLSFVPDGVGRYAYAASIGLNEIPDELYDNYRVLLNRFDLIGVRETQGVHLLSELAPECSDRISDVLDPTFLVPVCFWDELSLPPKKTAPFLFCYFLGSQKWHREYAAKWAKSRGLITVIYSDDHFDRQYADRHICFMGPREFLGYIREAAHIMTDSFHGTAFSIIYQKQFHIFYRFLEDDPICQNSRIDNIIDKFGIEAAVVRENGLDYGPVDYKTVNENVSREIRRSKAFADTILVRIGEKNA